MHVKVLSAKVVCCILLLTSLTNFGIQTGFVDPDQTSPSSLIWVHFVCYRNVLKGPADNKQQTTLVTIICRGVVESQLYIMVEILCGKSSNIEAPT